MTAALSSSLCQGRDARSERNDVSFVEGVGEAESIFTVVLSPVSEEAAGRGAEVPSVLESLIATRNAFFA